MDSSKLPRVFLPLDLEILDYVYQAAWARIEARDLYRDRSKDGEIRDALWKRLLAFASPPVDFDTLYDTGVASLPETGTNAQWISVARPQHGCRSPTPLHKAG